MNQHIFLIDTELQCYAALKIIDMENITSPIFFCFSKKLHNYLSDKGFTSNYLDKTTRGWHKRLVRYHRMVTEVGKASSGRTRIYLARLDLVYTNVIIGTLSKKGNIEVSIIPEGMLNYVPEDISVKGEHRHRRWNIRLAYGLTGLRKLIIKGERIGVDCPIVSSVYCFSGIESPYPPEKIKYIELAPRSSNKTSKSALVVGQPIIKKTSDSREIAQAISTKVKELLEQTGITNIDYAPHPRDANHCMSQNDYNTITHNKLCLEEYLETQSYSLIISCYSTPLVTAKIIFGADIESISVGFHSVPIAQHTKDSLEKIYRQAGVKVIRLNKN